MPFLLLLISENVYLHLYFHVYVYWKKSNKEQYIYIIILQVNLIMPFIFHQEKDFT